MQLRKLTGTTSTFLLNPTGGRLIGLESRVDLLKLGALPGQLLLDIPGVEDGPDNVPAPIALNVLAHPQA